jgi:alginate O-acetyltransferase complex protein AlgI
MIFNSYSFIFLFLPTAFFGVFWLGRYSRRLSALWAGLASLTFYAVWDAHFVLLLLGSIALNYCAGYWLGLRRVVDADANRKAKRTLVAAIAANLTLLGYFKYTNFFIDSFNHLLGSHIPALDIILPLGISFFTFTQIAFLVDVYRGIVREVNFIHYLLFVTWFPHLIAGPVLHHKQIMPQFDRSETFRINLDHVAIGLTIFIIGLAKKVLIADNLALYATPIFNAASEGLTLMLFEAWVGALAYTLQLYFDFTGYSDMAIGLSLMFNVRLPLNFDSPYKATNIIDFWRRWHMTLAAFLRDYLYIPFGGNRKGSTRRYVNLMITMLLGGLWHGAGWTFVVWGGLHGLYLMINHGWREVKARRGWKDGGGISKIGAGALTFLAVQVSWVFFRADSFSSAQGMLAGMAGMNGVSLPTSLEGKLEPLLAHLPFISSVFEGLLPITMFNTSISIGSIGGGLALVWLFPNVQQIMKYYIPILENVIGKTTPAPMPKGRIANLVTWRSNVICQFLTGFLFFVCISSMATKVSEFLYFQF